MGGGAWPFLVGGVICLVNSDNERDSSLLNSLLTGSTLLGCLPTARGSFGTALPSIFSKRVSLWFRLAARVRRGLRRGFGCSFRRSALPFSCSLHQRRRGSANGSVPLGCGRGSALASTRGYVRSIFLEGSGADYTSVAPRKGAITGL